jgi:nucleoside-diphosphate-sugar epimerase
VNSLVLGGTGFVGRRLVEVLVAGGNKATVLNRGVTPVELPPSVDRLVADRSDPASMQSALATSDWDAVFDISGVVKVASGTDAGDIGRYVYVSSQSLYRMIGEFALADVVGARADVIRLPKELAEKTHGPLFSRLFTPVHHGMLDASKITKALGVMPSYDLRAGHANTLEWYRRSGAAAVENALSDPLWNRTFDFGYEAEVAAHVRNAPLRKDA